MASSEEGLNGTFFFERCKGHLSAFTDPHTHTHITLKATVEMRKGNTVLD